MTDRLYITFFEAIGLRFIVPLGLLIALLLYYLGNSALSLGLLYGITIGLLDLWLMFLGVLRLARGPRRPLAQWLIAQSYLGRLLLLGFLLWLSIRWSALDFFAAAGGLLLPRVVLFCKNRWDQRWASI